MTSQEDNKSVVEAVKARREKDRRSYYIIVVIWLLILVGSFLVWEYTFSSSVSVLLPFGIGFVLGLLLMRVILRYQVPAFMKILSGDHSDQAVKDWLKQETDVNNRFVADWNNRYRYVVFAIFVCLIILGLFDVTSAIIIFSLSGLLIAFLGMLIVMGIYQQYIEKVKKFR